MCKQAEARLSREQWASEATQKWKGRQQVETSNPDHSDIEQKMEDVSAWQDASSNPQEAARTWENMRRVRR